MLSGKPIGRLDRLPHRASSKRGESGQKISGVKGEYLGNKPALLSVLKELPNRGYFWPLEFVVAWYLESIKRQQKHIDVMRRDDNFKFHQSSCISNDNFTHSSKCLYKRCTMSSFQSSSPTWLDASVSLLSLIR